MGVAVAGSAERHCSRCTDCWAAANTWWLSLKATKRAERGPSVPEFIRDDRGHRVVVLKGGRKKCRTISEGKTSSSGKQYIRRKYSKSSRLEIHLERL